MKRWKEKRKKKRKTYVLTPPVESFKKKIKDSVSFLFLQI